MSKITKRIMKSLLVSSALSILHSVFANAQELKHELPDTLKNRDNEIQSLKRKIIKNVVKINPHGRMMISDHYSHSSHRSHSSHYSSSGGHYSHSSHNSHSSHYSSSGSNYNGNYGSNGTYEIPRPKVKTTADYSLGDRIITAGTYGADVNTLAELLISNLYLQRNTLTKDGNFYVCDSVMINAINHFQRDAGYPATCYVDSNTATALQAWSPSKTSVTLGIRELKLNTAGQDVNRLITLLNKAGYPPDPKKLKYSGGNAVFTLDVQMAVKMYQAYNSLRVTGDLDTATLAKLKGDK